MASTASPPKPWERAQAAGAAPSSTSTALSTVANTTTPASNTTSSTSTAPAIPERPSSLNSVVNRTASSYTNPAATAYNRPYGSAYSSPYSSMSSPYSRFGGGMYGSGMYGGGMYGMGGMGGMGGYGGMYGMGGMGGMGGPYGQGQEDPNSMTQNFAQSTQATFQIIESIVGAFGGFAQMLESTYMATHSSFFAMVSVADQFGTLRQTLGSVLGIYTLLRWARTLFAKLTGRPPPADATALTPAAFSNFLGGGDPNLPPGYTTGADGRPVPKPSKKPFIMFLLAVFGLPYLMGKLIRALAKSAEANANGQVPGMVMGPDGSPLPLHMQPPHVQQALQAQQQQQNRSLDPSKLDFCRVLFDFPPTDAVAAGQLNGELDLSVKKGDLVAVLDKSDPEGRSQEGEWWRCRARDGRMGYLPKVYLETIRRQVVQEQSQGQGQIEGAARANSLPSRTEAKGEVKGKVTPPQSRAQTMAEGFQRSWGTGQ